MVDTTNSINMMLGRKTTPSVRKNEPLENCPDCGVRPGQQHKKNCDVERCSVCGKQRLMEVLNKNPCKGHNKTKAKWTGHWLK